MSPAAPSRPTARPPLPAGPRRLAGSPPLRPILVFAWIAAFACTCLTRPCAARPPLVVAQDGSGHFTSISAAVDSLARGAPTDSVIVMPGHYDEDVRTPAAAHGNWPRIWAPGGPGLTSVRSVGPAVPPGGWTPSWGRMGFDGFRIVQPVVLGFAGENYDWVNCVFEAGFSGFSGFSRARIQACTFRGPVQLDYYSDEIRDCSFERAPLYVRNGIGSLAFRDCSFRGPCDTLVQVRPRDDSGVAFEDCAFRDAGVAIAVENQWNGGNDVGVRRCRFSVLETIVAYPPDPAPLPEWAGSIGLYIEDCDLSAGSRAIDWKPLGRSTVQLLRCVASGTRGTSLDIYANRLVFDRVYVHGAGGDGGRVRLETIPSPYHVYSAELTVVGSAFTGNAGHGLIVTRGDHGAPFEGTGTVSGSRFDGNGGHGLAFPATRALLERCVIRRNDSTGVIVELASDSDVPASCLLTRNTVLDNGADGIAVEDHAGPGPRAIERTIVASNGGVGVRVSGAGPGTLRWNDLWANAGGAFVAPGWTAGPNLEVDPMLCDPAAADVPLRPESPCGPLGPYGWIGAGDETCPALVGAGDATAERPLHASPNPARGAVRFALPAAIGAGRVEVLDVRGRRLWSRALDGGAEIRWDGATATGPAPPGVYLVRLSAPGATATRRFVWLGR